MISAVYKLQWDSGHFYVGKSYNIKNRYYQHIANLLKGKHSNKRVTRCYKKHGEPKLEIIQEFKGDGYNLEKEILSTFINNPKCLNFCIDDKTAVISYKSMQGRPVVEDESKAKSRTVSVTPDQFELITKYFKSLTIYCKVLANCIRCNIDINGLTRTDTDKLSNTQTLEYYLNQLENLKLKPITP